MNLLNWVGYALVDRNARTHLPSQRCPPPEEQGRPAGVVDRHPDDPTLAKYEPTAFDSFDISIGDYHVEGDLLATLGYVRVDDGGHSQYYGLFFRTGAIADPGNGVAPYAIQLVLRTGTPDLSLTDAFPDEPTLQSLDVVLPSIGGINFLTFGAPGVDRFDWAITSYTMTP